MSVREHHHGNHSDHKVLVCAEVSPAHGYSQFSSTLFVPEFTLVLVRLISVNHLCQEDLISGTNRVILIT